MLNKESCRKIREILEDRWFDPTRDSAEAEQFSLAISSLRIPEELYVVAALFPWDDDWRLVECLLDHPGCDRSVALMVYWRCNPPFVYRRIEKRLPLDVDQRLRWEILKRIEVGFERDYRSVSIAVSPKAIVGKEFIKRDPANPGFDLVPEVMKIDLVGSSLNLREIRDAIFAD